MIQLEAFVRRQSVETSRRPRSSRTRFWRHYVSTFSMTMFSLLVSLSVHSAKHIRSLESLTNLILFTCGSTFFNISGVVEMGCAQVESPGYSRHVCLYRDPTVLIDTQTRLVIQRIRTNTGTLLMAVIKIIMRTSKLAFVKYEVRHRQRI